MYGIKVSKDTSCYQSKPTGEQVPLISRRIGKNPKLLKTKEEIFNFACDISLSGHTFCPATFKNGERNKENFEQQQLFALDFDNGIPFDEVRKRAYHYELPILFSYDTFSSKKHDRFRVVFLNDVPITDRKVAEAMSMGLGTIFPEADRSCTKDVSKMYYGGFADEVLYLDHRIPEINIEALFRNVTNYFEDQYGSTHLRRYTEGFSKETGLSLNEKGRFDVSVIDDLFDINDINDNRKITGDPNTNTNGKNSPTPIIYTKINTNIIAVGEKLPNRNYILTFGDGCTSRSSVGKKKPGNHFEFRSTDLNSLGSRCQLFKAFISGDKMLKHNELFGIATNLVNAVDSGSTKFMEIIHATSRYNNKPERYKKWEMDLKYIKGYKPYSCNNFCRYWDKCLHGTNMLSRPKRGTVEKIHNYDEDLAPSVEIVQEDVNRNIRKAYQADGFKWQIINAMTAIGKTTFILRLMSDNQIDRFLIAAPTNLLKNQIYADAIKKRLNIDKTPSLEEIKDEMPIKIWKKIQKLYKRGRHDQVHPFICETLKKKDFPCLRKYMEEREKLKDSDGSLVTTHRYCMNMDIKRLAEYDAVIIDEDIIFKSIISNQGEITISNLEKLLEETDDDRLSEKISELLKLAETESYIELNGFEWEYDDEESDGISVPFDIPSFCLTKYFYVRRKSKEKNLKEDTVAFIKPVFFKDVKYIMVSATADEKICSHFFGGDKINFVKCKKAKYKGNLYQYPQKSMSRTCIDNNPGIIERLIKRLGIDKDNVITFMKYGIGQLHYGNTEGSNSLEGKDLLIIGTPYHAEFLYKLIAFTMGLPFDEGAEMKDQLVTRNGYRFWIKTYEDDALRDIHFWMMESELEQAVGRARLLRNDCDVHLFSNFPLSQAVMKEIDYEQLETEGQH